jgi:hypothetical protein
VSDEGIIAFACLSKAVNQIYNLIFQLKWGDGYEGQGEQFYDYNHGPGKYVEEPSYAPAPPAYAPPPPSYLPSRR